MRKIYSKIKSKGTARLVQIAILVMLGIGNVWGQTTLISPTGDGGFESGTTFAANGWTTVNATTNIWVCGSSSSGSPLANWWSGSRGAFISNNSGTNWAYTNSTAQRSHIYRDISFPAGETTITLTFDWRGNGNDGDWDNLQVYIMNTTITPTTSGPTGTNTTTTGWSGYTNGTTGYYLTKINGTSSPTSTTTITYNFTAAQGTFCAGSTKRLVFTWKNDGSGGANPPAAIDNISLVSSCSGATTAAASAITATSASANWTAFAGATSYDLRHRAVGAPSWTTLTTLAGTSTSLSSLTSNTNYEYQVKANGPVCNAWSSSRTFSTLCNPYSIPYTEGFETGYTHNTAIGGCNSQASVTGAEQWTANNAFTDYNRTPRTGSFNAFLRYSNEDWLFIPISLTGGTSYTASVYARQDGSATADANIAISYGTTNSAAGMTNSVVSATGINASYQLISGAFTPSSTGTYYVGIKGFMNGTPWYISLDDISINLTPTCLAPTITATTSISATTATINWTAASPAPSGGYQWEVRTSGAGGSGGAGLVASGTVAAGVLTASATGLTASTAYTVYVRSDCGGSGFSTWASGGAFTTLCAAITTFPHTQPFATYLPNTCWQEGDAGTLAAGPTTINSTASSWTEDGFLNSGTTQATKINIDATGDNDWLISPQFTLPASPTYRLTYSVGATQWNGTGAPTTAWEADDYVEVLVSTSGFTNWTILKTFNNTNVPSHLGQTDILSLSAYAGQTIRLAFRGVEGASDGGADIDFFVDNFVVEEIPAPTITSVTSSQTCADTTKVVIIGTNLSGISAASINGVSLMTLDSNTNTRAVKFMTTAFTSGGNVSVTNGGGTATQANTLAFTISPALTIDSPNFAICRGSTSTAVSVTPATVGNYSTYAWTPTTGVTSPSSSSTTFTTSANTTYTLTGTGGGCSRTRTLTITIADTPSRLTLSQGFVKPKCDSRIDSLMASGGLLSSSGVIGTATTLTGSTTQPTAFCNRWRSYWHQMVFTPSELTSLGMTAGSQINSLRFNITTLGDGTNVTNATIRIGNAALSTLSAFQTTGLTQVFSASTYTHTIGLNIFNFSSPYTWDGSSNLLVELFHNGADITNNSQTYFTATAGNTSVTAATSTNHANVAAYAAVNPTATPSTSRINTTFGFSVQQNITWSPSGAGSGLFTDRAASAAYSSGHAAKLYSKPSTTTKYYAQAQNGICIVRDSIVDSAKATTDMVILALGSASGATAQCTDGGWTYYGTAADPDKLIFAIDKSAATGLTGETVTITVDGSNFSHTSSNGANQEHKSIFMKRSWDVTAPSFTGTAKVRFFYDPTDSADVISARNTDSATLKTTNPSSLLRNTPFTWFKSRNTAYTSWRSANVRGNQFTAGTYDILTPTYGTLNGINYVEFTVSSFSGGTGGAGFGPSGGGGGVGLPVTWAGFDVKTAEVGNELTWKTASEQNTDYFEVQYSYDAKEFIAIPDHIPAAGNSADLRTYNFTHADFAPYVYYRIKQVDLDGKFDYSAIKLAKRAAGPSFVVNVFPIPMQEDNLLHVSAKGIDKSAMSITMTDITGKVIRHLSYIPSSESIKESFDMSPLTPGIYFIEVQNGQGKETFKVSR